MEKMVPAYVLSQRLRYSLVNFVKPLPDINLPVNYAFVVFPTFQALDVFGPLDALNMLSLRYHTNLSIIAETLDPVSTSPRSKLNPFNSTFGESIVPTHTFQAAPPNIDILMIPGGFGTLEPLNSTVDFIRDTYPNIKYLITVCTGAWLAAKAGVLEGRNATTNKATWEQGTKFGKGVHWIARARWVGFCFHAPLSHTWILKKGPFLGEKREYLYHLRCLCRNRWYSAVH
jgi:putative intracellular protease/amidase